MVSRGRQFDKRLVAYPWQNSTEKALRLIRGPQAKVPKMIAKHRVLLKMGWRIADI